MNLIDAIKCFYSEACESKFYVQYKDLNDYQNKDLNDYQIYTIELVEYQLKRRQAEQAVDQSWENNR